jgi:hypothetical protein
MDDFKPLRRNSFIGHIRMHGDILVLDVKSITIPDRVLIDAEGINRTH